MECPPHPAPLSTVDGGGTALPVYEPMVVGAAAAPAAAAAAADGTAASAPQLIQDRAAGYRARGQQSGNGGGKGKGGTCSRGHGRGRQVEGRRLV